MSRETDEQRRDAEVRSEFCNKLREFSSFVTSKVALGRPALGEEVYAFFAEAEKLLSSLLRGEKIPETFLKQWSDFKKYVCDCPQFNKPPTIFDRIDDFCSRHSDKPQLAPRILQPRKGESVEELVGNDCKEWQELKPIIRDYQRYMEYFDAIDEYRWTICKVQRRPFFQYPGFPVVQSAIKLWPESNNASSQTTSEPSTESLERDLRELLMNVRGLVAQLVKAKHGGDDTVLQDTIFEQLMSSVHKSQDAEFESDVREALDRLLQ